MREQSRTTLKSSPIVKFGVALVLTLVLTVPLAEAGNSNPGVLPANSHAYGNTYAEWSAAWWQWALAIPATEHPLFDTADCSAGQSGKVWFLGGKFCRSGDTSCNAQSATRNCTLPTGTALFFPIVNSECAFVEFPANSGVTEADLRACADVAQFGPIMSATVDGRAIQGLGVHGTFRVQSPLFDVTLAPHDNLLAAIGSVVPVPDGATSPAVADGVYPQVA